MRHLLTALIFFFLAATAGTAQAVKIGSPAPDFTLKDTAGKAVSLSSFKGKGVILNFWSTTCTVCVAELPSLERLRRQMGNAGVVVIGIALDRDPAAVREVMARNGLGFPVLLDPDRGIYFDSYGLFGLPITLLINRNGIVVDRVIGGAEWALPSMQEKIKKIL